MLRKLRDELAWIYYPHRFLFDGKQTSLKISGWETLAFVTDSRALRSLNAATGKVFFGGAGNAFLGPLMGDDCVFLLDGARHKQARKAISQTLDPKSIALRGDEIDALIVAECENLKDPIDLARLSRGITMRIMCKLVVGSDDRATCLRVLRAYENVTGFTANIVSYKKPLWRSPGPLFLGALARFFVRGVDRALTPLIEVAKHDPDYPESVLKDLVCAHQRGELSEKALRDNLVGTLAAGYDTTACALSWTFYWLAREGQALREALPEGSEAAQIERHIQAFRNEVLRYCPPVEILPRKIDPEKLTPEIAQEVFGRRSEPLEATMVCPMAHRAHHDPKNFPDPDTFDHLRFVDSRPPNQTMYFPFGAGERLCLGIHLGRRAVDGLIAVFLQQPMQVTLSRSDFRVVRRNVSIWPGRRTWGSVRLKERQSV